MKSTALWIVGSIFGLLATILYATNQSAIAHWFVFMAVLMSFFALIPLSNENKRKADGLPDHLTLSGPSDNLYAAQPTDPVTENKINFKFRSVSCPLLGSPDIVLYLEQRYACVAFRLAKRPLPVTVLWWNISTLIHPDCVLSSFDSTTPTPLTSSETLNTMDYTLARDFIRRQFEAPPSPIQHEGVNYRLLRMDLSKTVPQISGAFGFYYDNVLTQYALEWELKKALLDIPSNSIERLDIPGTLPLREAIEALSNPLVDGSGRCTSITVSTLLVFARSNGEYYTIVRRRSNIVGLSPGLNHVVPAGMFEAPNIEDKWSVEANIWRELLEEVYNEKEQAGSSLSEINDYLRNKSPIDVLVSLQQRGKAELSITGVCCDLLNLRPELCTILFVSDPAFAEARRMELNWEYESEGRAGTFGVPWSRIDELIESLAETGEIVVSGAVSLGLGREWVRSRHGI